MVKSVTSVNHVGLRDWIIQRVSALLMAVYFVGIIVFFVAHPDVTYTDWYNLFSSMSVKIITLLLIVSLLWHAWIGIWTVITDYIKCSILRLTINSIVLLVLVAFFLAGLFILWGF